MLLLWYGLLLSGIYVPLRKRLCSSQACGVCSISEHTTAVSVSTTRWGSVVLHAGHAAPWLLAGHQFSISRFMFFITLLPTAGFVAVSVDAAATSTCRFQYQAVHVG